MDSPEGRLLMGTTGYAGKAGQTIFKGAKSLAKSPLTVGAGLYYGGGALLPDGTPVPNDPKNQVPDNAVTGKLKVVKMETKFNQKLMLIKLQKIE